ncbi:benzoate carboxyl methyltransferase [Sesamum indicum]|uniref:Benzoate carboxyl methyltransferase n=1 Tax=Sesamum indicum TaxID=4182 RepID=A0A6I9U4H8_SESIN|nr:benzoate carboxyl methyltransferase [Sesamum indicum]
MVVKNVMNMNPGDGATSYANNSGLQKAVMSEALPLVDETLEAMFSAENGFHAKCLKLVDLGCSSGPNTLFIISHILNTIEDLCSKRNNSTDHHHLPEFEVFLNDLPDNDFNNLFKLLLNSNVINGKKKRHCFLYGLPGSFYCRLFPSNTLHFAYSCYSLHWLSQVPEGIESRNKENICIARTSSPEVFEAYAKQYQRDFSTFLSLRGEEMIVGGRMVLIFRGRSVEDPSRIDDSAHITLLSQTLLDMVDEELVKKEDLYSFNIPLYAPREQEVKTVIETEGSFHLDKLQGFRVRWDAHDNVVDDDENNIILKIHRCGKLVADCVRAFMEPMLAAHFGSSIVDELFGRYAKKVEEHFSMKKSTYFVIVISLSRKGK